MNKVALITGVTGHENTLEEHLYNVGTGVDLTIKNLAELIQSIVGHEGDVLWDDNKPDGTPRKLLDVSRIELKRWYSKIGIVKGISNVYNWYQQQK